MSSAEAGLDARLRAVQARIAQARAEAGRAADSVKLLAVSKRQPAAAVRALAGHGQRDFGENYLSEALDKMQQLRDLPLCWHFIGPLQSNKTRAIAEHFAWVHSVDRLKLAQRLSAQRPAQLPPLDMCVEVNISAESSKHGVTPAAAAELCQAIAELPRLRLRGLMCIPAPAAENADNRAAFAAMRRLFEQLRTALPALDTLSMGMSADLEAAIAEGATIVRLGTALFGPRPP